MAPRDKGKAESPRPGDAPDQAKRRRCGAATTAAPPRGLEVAARGAGSVHTDEMMDFDIAHNLRGRRVWVRNTNKPGPLRFRKGEKPVYDVSWRIPACVKVALEHYNRLTEDVHELVKAVDGYFFLYNGGWMHATFIAKSKLGIPKSFFAELKIEGRKNISCTMCTEMDPDDPRGGCEVCPIRIVHPATGGYLGAKSGAGGQLGACGKAAVFSVDAMASE